MKLPFTTTQFFEVFKNYNEEVFPAQIIFYFICVIVIYWTFKPNRISSKIISSTLTFFWLWIGIVYHILYFTEINSMAYVFGGMFILQGILFLLFGVLQNKFYFQFTRNKYGFIGIILISYSLMIYPIIGYYIGHIYPNSPTFGLPCPTTIFTFGLLLLNVKKCPITILIIPFIWSLIGVMAAIEFGIFEDLGMLVASLVTVSLLIHRNSRLNLK